MSHVSSRSSNVIYGIFCVKCSSVVYVGETGNELYTRMQDHLSKIRHNYSDSDVAQHFNNNNHRNDQFRVIGIEKVRQTDKLYRRGRETFWIECLKTMKPVGLNNILNM